MTYRAENAVLPSGNAKLDDLIGQSQTWLTERGETIIGSGCFSFGSFSGSIHTDFGPEEQDKDTNQDYALAWWPRTGGTNTRVRFALAVADGLSESFRSECASALACWVALRTLVEDDSALKPRELAERAFDAAGLAIGQLADERGRDPQASCPQGQFLSTWKYILRKGVLFQTTLTLAWLDRDFLRIAMVGDGGAIWREYDPEDRVRLVADQILAQCDLDEHQVYALGPADRCGHDFDCWHERRLRGPFLCALYTDGVGRSLGRNPLALLDELESLEAAKAENLARKFIKRAVEQRPCDFADNLTLAIIRAD